MIQSVFLENFKGTTAEIEFKQLNIFRGTSGSGKSTWLEAVRVAIAGHDSGYGKLLAETMAFASGPRMSVAASHNGTIVKRIFEDKDGKLSQTILINGTKTTKLLAEQEIAKTFGQFPMMLNPDEFFDMSDDKKITFLFGLSNTETNSAVLRRDCVVRILGKYTDAVPLIMEYEFKMEDYHALNDNTFGKLVNLAIDKVAKKDVEAGRALIKIFSEFFVISAGSGQEALSMYAYMLKEEINATRRAKGDAEAANRKLMEEKTDKLKLINFNDAENQEEIEKLRGEIAEIEKELHANEKLTEAKNRFASGIEIHGKAISQSKERLKSLNKECLDDQEVLGLVALQDSIESGQKLLLQDRDLARNAWEEIVTSIAKLSGTDFYCRECQAELECPNCKEKVKVSNEEAVKLQEKKDKIDVHLVKVNSTLDGNLEELKTVEGKIAKQEKDQEAYEVALRTLGELEGLLKSAKENLDKMKEPGAGDDTLKAQVSGLKVTLGERLVAAKNHDWLRTLSATIAKANETIGNSTALLSALGVAISEVKVVRDELTASATGRIEEVCNGLLQEVDPSFNLKYDIEDGKFDIRCIGVEGREVAFKTLSGGEKVLYLSAQLLALMTIVDPKLKILEVEMGELSGDLVPPFMDALKAMTEGTDIQVILSSCHKDFEVNGHEWEVHEMGE